MSTIDKADDLKRRKATLEADKLKLVAVKLETNREARLNTASGLMIASRNGKLDDNEFARFQAATRDAQAYDDQATLVRKFEAQQRSKASGIVKLTERPTYGPLSPNSFYADQALRNLPHLPSSSAAAARLQRYEQELDAKPTDQVRSALREVNRNDNPSERRAMSSASSSGGSFVTPAYIVEQWSAFKSANRTFTDQTSKQPLPSYGLQVNVPSFTSATSAAQQSENAGVSETDPSGAYITATLVPITGQVTISQQLFDRGGTASLATDAIIAEQLKEQLDAAIDAYVLTQVLAGAGSVTNAGTYSTTGLYTDLSKAREILTDTAGTRLPGTHAFMTSDLFGHVSSQVDSSARPVISPAWTAQPWTALAAAGDPQGLGFTGHVFPGGLAAFTDDNIAPVGGNTSIVVARPSTVLVFEGSPITFSYPDTSLAGDLSVIVGLRSYIAVVAKHAKAVASISGAAYPSSLV